MTPIDTYLSSVRSLLRHHGPRSTRPVAELEDHLRSSAVQLQKMGLDPVRAEREAVARMGPPQPLATALDPILNQEAPMERIAKLVGALNLFTAGSGAILNVVAGASAHIMVGTVVLAGTVLVGAVAAWRRSTPPIVVLAAALALVALGGAAAMWTLAAGLFRGDPEYWATCLASTYMGQGVVLAALALRRADDAPSADPQASNF